MNKSNGQRPLLFFAKIDRNSPCCCLKYLLRSSIMKLSIVLLFLAHFFNSNLIAQSLTFKMPGGKTKELSLKELKKVIKVKKIAVFEPHEAQ